MATLNVNSVAGFNAAINSAHGGDVIALAAGTYSNILIANHTFSSGVTITSQDLTHPATLVGLGVANSSNLTFSHLGLTIVGTTDPYYGFRIDNSQNITLSNLDVHGDPTLVAYAQKAAFYITYSSGVTIQNSTFEHMGQGVTVNNDTNVNISNNTFTYLSKGGIEMGGSSNVSISNNLIDNFQVSQGTHPDGIQIYTAGFTASAHDISVTNNLIDRGNGDAIQGIFIQDETGVLPFINLNVQNNTVLGGMWDSLYINGAKGNVTVANNYVASWAGVDQEGNGVNGANGAAASVTGFSGYIWLQNLSGATITEYGNTAQAYLGQGGAPLAPPTGNTWIGQVQAQTALTSPLSAITAVAQKFTGDTYGTVTGNVLAGDVGNGVFLESVITAAGASSLVSTGTSFAGTYGTLKISSDGSFGYTANISPTIGVSYDDKFTLTVGSSGQATSTTLDIIVTSTGVGDGKSDVMTGGASASRFSNFGTGSLLTSGVGADTFVFGNVGQSTLANETVIKGFKAGDIIDLSGISPNLRVVSRFDGHAGEVVLSHMGTGNWQVQVDTDGNGSADFAVHVVNTTTDLSAASFNFSPATAASNAAAAAASAAAATTASANAAAAATATAAAAANAAAANAAAAATAAAATAAATAAANAAAAAAAPVAVAHTSAALEHGTVTGNALTGDTGVGLSLVSVGIGSDAQRAVAAGGTTFVGQHGALTIKPDGSYSYVELRDALTAGTVWDDHFTITVAAANGKQTSTTLDFMVTGSPTGNGGVNYITGGASATTISGFGAGSQLTSGVGADTFVFNSISQSTLANETLIKGFKSGDIIDLAAIDPAFQLVSRFDGHAHEIMLAHIGNGNWQVEGDTTGLGAPTFAIHVFTAASANLSAASFHL